MTIIKPDTDPPEWTLYDQDFKTVLGILRGQKRQLFLKLNGEGAGEMTIPETDPLYDQIKFGQFVGLNYRGKHRGGFLIETFDYKDISNAEYAGEVNTISGKGEMGLIDDAIEWDYLTPGTDDIRFFGIKNVLLNYGGGHSVPKGEIIYRLLNESKSYIANMPRYCFRLDGTVNGQSLLDWDFTMTEDSNGTPWSDAEDMQIKVGTSLLDVISQIAALQYDFKIDFDHLTGQFMLHCYNSRIGSDLSSTIIFRPGQNCTNLSRKITMVDVRNALLGEFSNPVDPFVEVDDYTSLATQRRRRESLLQCANAVSAATATAYATAEMATVSSPKFDIQLAVSDAVKPYVFNDYDIGDTIGYCNRHTGIITPQRINGMELSWPDPDQRFANVIVEFSSL